MNRVPFYYTPDERLFVIADGPEVFVYSGQKDTPVWKAFADGILVGIAATGDRVFAVDADGRVVTFKVIDASKIGEQHTDRPTYGLAFDRANVRLGLIGDDGVLLTDGENAGAAFALKGARFAAFGEGKLAIASGSGRVEVFEVATGKSLGSNEVGGPVSGVAWRPLYEEWVVAGGEHVTFLSADLKKVEGKIQVRQIDADETQKAGELGPLAIDTEGALLAVVVDQQIAVFELFENKRVGTIRFQRVVSGVGFGKGTWLAIGLDDAEGNRVELSTGQLKKTEPFGGRSGGRWAMQVVINHALLKQGMTYLKAQGKPIATAAPKPKPTAEAGAAPKRGWGAGRILMILVVLGLGCAGCAGIGTLIWAWWAGVFGPM